LTIIFFVNQMIKLVGKVIKRSTKSGVSNLPIQILGNPTVVKLLLLTAEAEKL
jgi:hypothetical protein